MLTLIREAGLPEPQCNVLVLGELVDFYWPQFRLVVEADGFEFHKSRSQFEKDRARDALFLTNNIRVLRLTQRRIENDAQAIVDDLLRLSSNLL